MQKTFDRHYKRNSVCFHQIRNGEKNMELQTQIRKYRKTLNLSQEELAEKIYVTRQTISNWKMEKAIRIFTVLFFLVLYSASL